MIFGELPILIGGEAARDGGGGALTGGFDEIQAHFRGHLPPHQFVERFGQDGVGGFGFQVTEGRVGPLLFRLGAGGELLV